MLTAPQPGGGLSLSSNRTYWPTTGGTLAFQPGWFSGHATAFLNVNIGLDSDGPDGGPLTFDHPLEDAWQLLGPSNGPYPGTLCLPDVKVPSDLGVKAGDNATIQIVELATHGASLFAVSPKRAPFLTPSPARAHPQVEKHRIRHLKRLTRPLVLRYHLRRGGRRPPPASERVHLLQHD